MRIDESSPEFPRLIAAWNAEGNPRVLRIGGIRYTWYTDEGKMFFLKTSAHDISLSLSQNSFANAGRTPRNTSPSDEPPLT